MNYLNNNSMESDFDTVQQKEPSYADNRYQNQRGGYFYERDNRSSLKSHGDKHENKYKMRNIREDSEDRHVSSRRGGQGSGDAIKLLKSVFGSLASITESKEPLKEGMKVLSGFLDGSYSGGSAKNFINNKYNPVLKFLGDIVNKARGGAHAYSALVENHDVLQKFRQTPTGKSLLSDIEVDPRHLGDSEVDEEKFKQTLDSLRSNILHKIKNADSIEKLSNIKSVPEKAAVLSSIYFDGDDPVSDLRRGDSATNVLANIIGGKYKFKQGASVDVIPSEQMRKDFKNMIFSNYNVSTKNGVHVVGEKKHFDQRVNENLKDAGVKLGGYTGGAKGDNLAYLMEFPKTALCQIFPFLYLFINTEGEFALPEITGNSGPESVGAWWLVILILIPLSLLGVGFFMWKGVPYFFNKLVRLVKKDKNEGAQTTSNSQAQQTQQNPQAQQAQQTQQNPQAVETPDVKTADLGQALMNFLNERRYGAKLTKKPLNRRAKSRSRRSQKN